MTELKEVDRLKDEFISIASHEMKSPVAAAKGFAQLLLKRMRSAGETANELELAERVTRQIDRMAELLEELLDISRIQSGRLALEREDLDLRPLVQEVADRVQMATEGHKLRLTTCDGAKVYADRIRVEQVLTNLLTNAIRYSPTGGQVDMILAVAGCEAQVSVSDRGIGIPHDKQPYVFERFFRAAEGGGGLGLGLYISRSIVEAHGGRIWLHSQEGKGSTFYFTLPLAE
ncbi:MAG: HAMP domain-containing histidine kinase [Chloroflexi bacterium]|nr:HAMP domain-containing histidine kinase [Chloroflexota bacterium]